MLYYQPNHHKSFSLKYSYIMNVFLFIMLFKVCNVISETNFYRSRVYSIMD